MKDYSPRYVPRSYVTDRSSRLEELVSRLEASAGRICDYQERLHSDIGTMKPIDLDRLMDKYRAEQVRYDHIDRELQQLDDPTKSEEYKSYHRDFSKQNRSKINY